jgi:hypothetical protein
MIIDGLSWHQFSSLPHIAQLPLNRQLIEYEIYNQNLIHEVYLTQQLLIQQEVVPSSAGSAAATVVEEGLSSGCIELIFQTTDGTDVHFEVETSALINYTISWGDGTEDIGVIDEYGEFNHEYADSDTEYTARLCFDDISLVTELDLED